MPQVNGLPTPEELAEAAMYPGNNALGVNDVYFCVGCGDLYHTGSWGDLRVNTSGITAVVGSWDDDRDNDGYYDDDDYDDPYGYRGVILNYGYKPRPIFHGDDSRTFLGLELELETDYDSGAHLGEVAERVQNMLGDVAYLKEDGSVDGFELVTHPMTYRWAAANFPWDVFERELAPNMVATGACGIHVHVSRAAFDGPAHLLRWQRFWHRNPTHLQRVCGRGSVGYARWTDSRERTAALGYAKHGRYDSDRYTTLNMQNEHTIEVRAFASTTEADVARARLGLVDASVEYTRDLTVADIVHRNGWDARAFAFYVNENGTWPDLDYALRNTARISL